MNVLFICTGNTCRSPMAEAILQHLSSAYEVKSAGIFANELGQTNEKTVDVLRENKININHEVRQVTIDLIQWANVVLTMTSQHKEILLAQFNESTHKIFTLIEYVTNEKRIDKLDIVDPFGGVLSDYEKVYDDLDKYINMMINNEHKQGDET